MAITIIKNRSGFSLHFDGLAMSWLIDANKFVKKFYGNSFEILVTETLRTRARQQQLFNLGRNKNGVIVDSRKVVTYTMDSMHRYGCAFDWVLARRVKNKIVEVYYGLEFYKRIYAAVPPKKHGLEKLDFEQPHLQPLNAREFIKKHGIRIHD